MRGLGRAGALAERFQADLDRPLGELSRGNRQKIGLVQAAFHEPELLMLDEPTGGLDPLMQEEFLAFVAEEREQWPHTVFLSSHELDEVERACDRVGIIREGRLVAVEDVAEITGRSYRHVTLEFADARRPGRVPPHPRRRRARARDGTRLTLQGDAATSTAVIKAAARHTVDRHRARPPDARGDLPHLLRQRRRPHERRDLRALTTPAAPRDRAALRGRGRCAPSCAAACATTAARR